MKQKEFFIISIGIFLTVMAWILADLYHENTVNVLKTNIEAVQPLDYQIDTNLFKILKDKTP